ncbi:SUMO-activating enzyme subunit 1 [Venturia canescens]|uniref:SUMO-activating enzyme subunit 1 n=1 Tax=Venturia canescens TaxID=32260 RepID=UPI001C9D0D70|nr:SUMO-activating enzyme subunit 1 [Venturia canescens]
MVDVKNNSEVLTDAEAELYDRQIRLWGLDSQKRLRAARILLVGLNGFGAEVAKNIILAGVKSVTFLDHKNVSEADTCSQFLVSKTDIGKNRAEASLERAKKLNPMVEIVAEPADIDSKSVTFYSDFDVVCATECTISQLIKINTACRDHAIKFFCGDVWGTFGYTFADLGVHEFVEDVVQTKKKPRTDIGESANLKEKIESSTNAVKRTEIFVPFEQILNEKNIPKDSEMYYLMQIMLNYREIYGKDPLPTERDSQNLVDEALAVISENNLDESIKNLIKGDLYAQISPVCAIVGGVMGQEIIKAVSQKEAPHNNLFLFDPDTHCGKILRLGH